MKKKAKQVEDAPQYDDFGQLIIKATKLKPKSKKELAKINSELKRPPETDIDKYFEKMNRESNKSYFNLRKIKKVQLDEYYKLELTKEEFEVIKFHILREYPYPSITYGNCFEVFREWIRPISTFYDGTERSKFKYNKREEKLIKQKRLANLYTEDDHKRDFIYGEIEKAGFPNPKTFKDVEREWHYTNDKKLIKRDISIPETITVRELSNRMEEQSDNVIKHLFKMGVTVTANQKLAADTAEHLTKKFGHNPIREKIPEEVTEFEEKPVQKENSKSFSFDPFFILRFIPDNAFGGFLVLLFLTWLIFSVILDIGPGSGPPRFFGHDGG